MKNKIDLVDFVEEQINERYKAFIIIVNILTFTKELIDKIVSNANGSHIDLIEMFNNNSELANRIDVFNSDDLKELLKNLEYDSEIIFVSGIDLLWNVWNDFEKNRFLKMIEKNTISSPISNKVYCFFMYKDPITSQLNLYNTYGRSRAIPIDQFVLRGNVR